MRSLYDRIGASYAATRRPNPRIAAAIIDALGRLLTPHALVRGSTSEPPP